jgi:TolB-like protein
MADIFISYSSKDKEKADQLSELLASAGLSVWIDQSALEVSTSWSAEIVDAISSCSAFIVLLSPNSIESHNVIKEVSLASEKRKKILPLDLEPITLPRELEYQLAGIHRTSMTNIDSIIRALGKLGLEATQAPTLKLVKETDSRKSLMILPFEDLSPTADNGWFTDGIVSELIQSLSNVKALRLMDAQTTKEFKKYNGHLTVYAKEMGVRYFVQGDVRKFGDNIKINSRLLDIETGDHLWQDSLKGTMDDIFDIQEQVAEKVVEGLKLHLSKEEKESVAKKPTENAEAYELWMKGRDYYTRHTHSDYEHALALFEEAVRLDPVFGAAFASIANTCAEIYRTYDRRAELLNRALEAAGKVRATEGETAQYYWTMTKITLRGGDASGALGLAEQTIRTDPKYAGGYDALAFVYQALGQKEEEVVAREKYVQLLENSRSAHFNLIMAFSELGDMERLNAAAKRAIPVFERYTRLNPDDYPARIELANIHSYMGNCEAALSAADMLSVLESLDGAALYNLGCLYLNCDQTRRGLEHLKRAVERGYRGIDTFRRDPDLAPLRGTPEFEELMKELEEKIAEEKHG